MSKTDKTKPWWVRVAEHRPMIHHDHRSGECTLPDSPYDQREINYRDQPCYYKDWNLCDPGSCCWGCGCPMCNDQAGRRRENRQGRYRARAALRRGDWDALVTRERVPR